jgi:hypothetical protein
MRHPEEFTDTDPRAMKVWLDLQRAMSGGDKLGAVLSASQTVLQMYEMGIRRLYPDASDEEVLVRVAARHLPADLVFRAYGWCPDDVERI